MKKHLRNQLKFVIEELLIEERLKNEALKSTLPYDRIECVAEAITDALEMIVWKPEAS